MIRGISPARIDLKRLRRLARQVAALLPVRSVILFGSRARGDAGPESDVDILVVTREPVGGDASLKLRLQLEYDFPLDLIVIDAERLRWRLEQGDNLLREAREHGKVLYEAPDP